MCFLQVAGCYDGAVVDPIVLVWDASVEYIEVTDPDKDKRLCYCAVIAACHQQGPSAGSSAVAGWASGVLSAGGRPR